MSTSDDVESGCTIYNRGPAVLRTEESNQINEIIDVRFNRFFLAMSFQSAKDGK